MMLYIKYIQIGRHTNSFSQLVSVQYKNNNKNNKINIYIFYSWKKYKKEIKNNIYIYAIVIAAFIINII